MDTQTKPNIVTESDWYRAARAEPDRRKRPPADVNHPEAGYYRFKRAGRWIPLHIRYEDGECYACEGGGDFGEMWLSEEQILTHWTWAMDNLISKETYLSVMNGGPWPDLDEAVAEHMRGHNRPPKGELEDIKADVENARGAVERYKEVTEETLEAAGSARARLNELANKIKKRYDELNSPLLEEQNKLRREWLDFSKSVRADAAKIGMAMDVWENKKADAQRKALEDAQRAADRAIIQGTQPEPPPPSDLPPPRTQIKGGYGRAAAVMTINKIQWDQPVDWKVVFAFASEQQQARDLLAGLLDKWVRNGQMVPGVTIKQERKVR